MVSEFWLEAFLPSYSHFVLFFCAPGTPRNADFSNFERHLVVKNSENGKSEMAWPRRLIWHPISLCRALNSANPLSYKEAQPSVYWFFFSSTWAGPGWRSQATRDPSDGEDSPGKSHQTGQVASGHQVSVKAPGYHERSLQSNEAAGFCKYSYY